MLKHSGTEDIRWMVHTTANILNWAEYGFPGCCDLSSRYIFYGKMYKSYENSIELIMNLLRCAYHVDNIMMPFSQYRTYRKMSNIRRPKSQNFNVSLLALWLFWPHPMKPCVDNEDVVEAAPIGDAPTTSEWSKIVLPTKVCLILETWR